MFYKLVSDDSMTEASGIYYYCYFFWLIEWMILSVRGDPFFWSYNWLFFIVQTLGFEVEDVFLWKGVTTTSSGEQWPAPSKFPPLITGFHDFQV